MRICILSSFEDSLLRDTGYSVRIYNLARGIAELGNNVHIVIPAYGMSSKKFNKIFVHKLRGFLPERVLHVLSSMLGVAKPTSLYFYDPIFIFRVGKIIRNADIVQIEQQPAGVFLVPLINKVWKKPVIADCHDVFQSLRIQHIKKLRRILETLFEKITYRYADALLTVSGKEKNLLISMGIDQGKIAVIPNGVDTEQFNNSFVNAFRVRERYNLKNYRIVIFVGNMEYSPNREAVELIASKIAPLIRKEIDNVNFLIVGRTYKKIDSPDLIFTGTVDNVAELLAVSDVAVAPLSHGSGTRLKILEYFSSRLPVVSTTVGVEGLGVKNGVHALIEDDIDNFSAGIIKLIKDRTLALKMGEEARQFVISKYEWKIVVKLLNDIYNNLLIKGRYE